MPQNKYPEFFKNIKFEKRLKKLSTSLNGKKVVIYGAGVNFEYINNNFDLSSLDIIAISDRRFESAPGERLGYRAVAPGEIQDLNPDYVLVGTLNSVDIIDYLQHKLLNGTKIKVKPLINKTCLPKKTKSSCDKIVEKSRKLVSCHFREPFVSHTGEIFPCCRVWGNPNKKIGHISDHDIINKMKVFDINCQCDEAKLKKWEGENVRTIFFETSLSCNASCAMCCVHAPSWRGKYDLYDALTQFITQLNPHEISVQGGECLAQPKTLQWLDVIRRKNSDIKIILITNGNASEAVYEQVKRIFTSIYISIVGFQDATYKKIMNIDFAKTKSFIKMIGANTTISLHLKYLITPINIHEIDLFFDWAAEQKCNSIYLGQASQLADIRFGGSIPFWETIIDRAGDSLRASLKRHAASLSRRNCAVYCSRFVVDYLKITPKFAAKIGLTTYGLYV